MTGRQKWILVLVLVVIVLLAAVAAYYATRPPPGPGCTVPTVSLSSEVRTPANVTFEVAGATVEAALDQYHTLLEVDNATSAEIDPLADNATDGPLAFADDEADGLLSVGDRFVVTPADAGYYALHLHVRACDRDNFLFSRPWWEAPAVEFVAAVEGATNVTVDVSSAAPVPGLASLRAIVFLNSANVG